MDKILNTSNNKSIDRILDKISSEGLDSLSLEERQFLDKVARKYKNKF